MTRRETQERSPSPHVRGRCVRRSTLGAAVAVGLLASASNASVIGIAASTNLGGLTNPGASQFTVTTPFNLSSVVIQQVEIYNTSTMTAYIYSDVGGTPGTAVASATNTLTAMGAAPATFSFSGELLSSGTTYWLYLATTGGQALYTTSTNQSTTSATTTNGTPNWGLKHWDGASWSSTFSTSILYQLNATTSAVPGSGVAMLSICGLAAGSARRRR